MEIERSSEMADRPDRGCATRVYVRPDGKVRIAIAGLVDAGTVARTTTRPLLAFSWEEYYQAYGLGPEARGQYRGKAALKARVVLESLAEPHRPPAALHGKRYNPEENL